MTSGVTTHSSLSVFDDESSPARIIRAAMDAIATHGIDHVTASHLIEGAHVARSTMYSYFGDVNGVFAELWRAAGPTWWDSLTRGDSPRDGDSEGLDKALTEIVLAAPRISDLYDVVAPDLATAFVRDRGSDEVSAQRLLWRWAITVGFRASVSPWTETRNTLLALIDAAPDDLAAQLNLGPFSAASEHADNVPLIVPLGPESPISEVLADASVYVAARAGIANASLLRICRYARVTTGAVPPALRQLDVLMLDGYRQWLRDVVATNLADVRRNSHLTFPEIFARNFHSSLSDHRATWRRYRRELHLAALHHDDIAAELDGEIEFTAGYIAENFEKLGTTAQFAQLLGDSSHAFSFAMSLFHDLGLPVRSYDHRLLAEWIFTQTGN
jgi:AcrR family transcriptional regulator